MALRLTDPVAPRTPPPSIPRFAAAAGPAHRTRWPPATCGYSALFADTAAIEDCHRRHQARKLLLQEGLVAPATETAAIVRALLAVARAAIELLEEEPREPGFLNIAGVAFYELGALAPAERLLEGGARARSAAAGAHPQPGAARAPQARRDQAVPQAAAALRSLSVRAKKVAAAARAATGMTLTLAMIVKDEEEHLGRCLQAAAPWVDQLVVVDTGSTDRTVEIALAPRGPGPPPRLDGRLRGGPQRVVRGRDLRLGPVPRRRRGARRRPGRQLRELLGHVWREAFFLVETNYTGSLEEGTAVTHNALRVFRNRPEYRFEGRMHEQIAHRLPGYLPERIELSDVRVDHYGYLGVVRDTKAKGAATSSCSSARRPSRERRRSCTTTWARSTPPPATARARWSASARRGRCCQAGPTWRASASPRSLAGRLVRRCAAAGRPRGARRGRRDPRALSGLHRHRPRAGVRRPRARR